MKNSLFFYPYKIEIISRRISYNHSSGILKRDVIEKITFRNNCEIELKEVILEVENFKPNLKITDNTKVELTYLPNYKIIQRDDIPEDVKNGIKLEGPEKRYILVIELNRTVEKGAYYSLYLNYIEYTREKEISNETFENSAEAKHFMHKEAYYMDIILFYEKETLSIFNQWEDGLSIGKSDPDILGSIDSDEQNDENEIIDLETGEIHLEHSKNNFSLSVSDNYRISKNINPVGIFYNMMPEKEEYNLIRTLSIFTVLLPFTGFTALYFHNFSYLFDSFEIESVFILTLAFAQTRTRLISHERYIKWIVIFAGVIFLLILFFWLLYK